MSTETIIVQTDVLDIACEVTGAADGVPVILLHGFPYDPRGYDEVVPHLVASGCHVIVPFLRGYGLTQYRDAEIIRSGQQGALAQDLLDLMNALNIERAVLAGYDWGGRAACINAALWPERVRGLVTCSGYNIHDLNDPTAPLDPAKEVRLWYQYYFHTERGRNALETNRAGIARLLWSMWSPTWRFDSETFARSAAAFDNDDFVETVLHSYRHRTGSAEGDPRYDGIEGRLRAQPAITVPTIVVHGADDQVTLAKPEVEEARRFIGGYRRVMLPGVGHNPPQEAPQIFAELIIELCAR